MPYRPIPENYDEETFNTSISVRGTKRLGETVHAQVTSPENSEVTIFPEQALDFDRRDWPLGTGRPEEHRVFLTFDNLELDVRYEVAVTTFDEGGQPIDRKVINFTRVPRPPEDLRLDILVTIQSPATNGDEVTGSMFFVTGTATASIMMKNLQVGTNLYMGELVRDAAENQSWIVRFSNIPTGAGVVFISDMALTTDTRNVKVV